MPMAVVDEEEKVEKKAEKASGAEGGGTNGGGPGLPGPLGWPGRKLAELRAFFVEVRSELKKVTWPSRKEVYSTTLVVIATSVLFGFYLWGLDLAFSRVMSLVLTR
jgi:preprotein translocase subunit SecE